jgi:hypothetical protein
MSEVGSRNTKNAETKKLAAENAKKECDEVMR